MVDACRSFFACRRFSVERKHDTVIMKKNLTELVFILDRSGSMGGLEPDAIGGFNAMLTRQKEQEGEANVTTILFDHEVQLLHDRFPLKAVAPLTEKDYYVRGCTALLDAIGYGVEKMANIQRHLPADERAEKVIFVSRCFSAAASSRQNSGCHSSRMPMSAQTIFPHSGADASAICKGL